MIGPSSGAGFDADAVDEALPDGASLAALDTVEETRVVGSLDEDSLSPQETRNE